MSITSYAVIHVQKFKSSDVKGIQIHNQRESPNSKNKDIDRERTPQNYDLRNPEPVNYNHKVKEIVKEGYKIDKGIRSDAVVMTGTLISSDKEFFTKLNPLEQKKYFQDAYDYLKERYGEKNIVAAVVHMDETTPHMHVISVPITEDGRLSAKLLFDRKALRELQDQLPKVLQGKGFEIKRGELGSQDTHVPPADFKKQEIKDLENEIRTLQGKVLDRQTDLKALQSDLTRLDGLKLDLDRVDQIEGKPGLLNKRKVSLPRGDFEDLKDMAKKLVVSEKKYLSSETKIKQLTEDNSSLETSFDKVLDKSQSGQLDNLQLRRKLMQAEVKLKNVNEFLEATNQVSTAIDFAKKIKQAQRNRNMDDLEL